MVRQNLEGTMNTNLQFFTDGEAYERVMGRWSRVVGVMFLDWLAMPKGLHWLDVGCGTGAFTDTIIAHCAPTSVAVGPRTCPRHTAIEDSRG